jgi:hypothetical protein
MGKIGRPTKLTPELIEKLCADIRNGERYEAVCARNMIAYTTYRSWMRKGEKLLLFLELDPGYEVPENEQIFIDLVLEVEAANAGIEGKMVKTWIYHSKHDWRAALEWLSRRLPDVYGANSKVRLEVEQVDDEIEELLDKLREAGLDMSGLFQ